MHKLPPTLRNFNWPEIIQNNVEAALIEDLNSLDASEDVSGLLLTEKKSVSATLMTREAGVLAGQDWFQQTFSAIDSSISLDWQFKDGDHFNKNQSLALIKGHARSILTAERTAMNFLQTLSATATQTATLCALIADTDCKLLDTRKTLPGLRLAQKYAVHCGGGNNHRMGLYDRFLIKENHILAVGGIHAAIGKARNINKARQQTLLIEVEVENLPELKQALEFGADIIMLDNFSPTQCREAVEICHQFKLGQQQAHPSAPALLLQQPLSGQNHRLSQPPAKPWLEASGNITAASIHTYAETGVDYISCGAITKSIDAIDLSLRIA